MDFLIDLKKTLRANASKEKAQFLQKYFKTGKGEYGEGDIFIGLTVPQQRKIAKKFFKSLTLKDVSVLLKSEIHEERFTALEILVFKFETANETERKEIFDFYLAHTKTINNWDLVDTSAPYIIGEFLVNKSREILYKLANSNNLWEKRISIVATYSFIKQNDFKDSLAISQVLLTEKHDLLHKAVGWMLREVGKRDVKVLENFLKMHHKKMPRTMLRYAIEKFPENERKKYLRRLL